MATSDTEMNDATSSQLSELDSTQFPDFSRTGSPDSAVTAVSTPSAGRGSKKRTQTAIETWAHAKKLKLDEQVRRDRAGNRIWVCGKCSWESASLTSARNHLDQTHGIKIKAQQLQVVVKGQAKLQQILRRQGEKQQAQAGERERHVLSKAINQKAFDESLLQLIINNNLPHKSVEYPELYSLIMSVNYMAETFTQSLEPRYQRKSTSPSCRRKPRSNNTSTPHSLRYTLPVMFGRLSIRRRLSWRLLHTLLMPKGRTARLY